ncbi:MAG: hypothetical protein GY936_14670, partial [Ignavibacteriae bacterium]|nr:hypothetical protein [Ignavibacteriota bacterium]
MYKLSFLILLLTIKIILAQQSPHGANFNYDCQDCHTTDTWKIESSKLNFEHAQTGFELLGQHKVIDCQSCHSGWDFSNTSKDCFQCHRDIHNNTVSKSCDNCHSSKSWVIENINDVHRMSRFPLVGAHTQADCQDCHKSINNLQFEQLGVDCIDCHISSYESATSPNHREANFSTDCLECHQITDQQWSSVSFEHNFFPLEGGHNIGNCFDCHNTNSFEGLSQDCIVCHQADYNVTTNPNHSNLNFSQDCLDCHSTNPSWRPVEFKLHDDFYPLLGAHKIIANDCAQCHTTTYENTPTDCFSCHKIEYDNTSNPNHFSAGFSADCETCHNLDAWLPATFDHDNQFFPIYSGEHNNDWNDCSDCHTNPSNYQVFECIHCHEHNQADMDDEHSGINGYSFQSSACLACHPTGSEEDGFSHSTTDFPLTGAHVSTDCSDCHTAGYSNMDMECVACHENSYSSSVNPNHNTAGISTKCEDCHTSSAWQPSSFEHSSTGFELLSGHNLPQCSSCHNGNTSDATSDCYSCHSAEYTTAPEHVSHNYPKECQQCHNTTNWEDATFDHAATLFPLTGAHVSVDCSTCHSNGYTGTSTECFVCHETSYTSSLDPNHSSSGVSTKCEDCHSTTAWQPSSFEH